MKKISKRASKILNFPSVNRNNPSNHVPISNPLPQSPSHSRIPSGYSGSTTVDLTENPTNQMSSWNTLPANYEDFQAELNHVKDGIEILQRLVTEYIQLEVKPRNFFEKM